MPIRTPEIRANQLSPAAAMAGQEEGPLDKIARTAATAGMIALGVPPQVAIAVTSSIGNQQGGQPQQPGDLPETPTEELDDVVEPSDVANQRRQSREILSQILGMELEAPTTEDFQKRRFQGEDPFRNFDDFDVFGF